MKKTIDEYMALPYTIEITPDENSFFVKVKELDGCMSVGSTKTEALQMIDDAMREWLAVAIEDGIEIPLPNTMSADRYSGKFPLRIPKSIHKKLALAAESDGVSLNQYMLMLLSERHSNRDLVSEIKHSIAREAKPSALVDDQVYMKVGNGVQVAVPTPYLSSTH